MKIISRLYEGFEGHVMKKADPGRESLIDPDSIRDIAEGAMTFTDMYISRDVFIKCAAVNNNGAFFFIPADDRINDKEAETITGKVQSFFSLNADNSFIFFAGEREAYLFDAGKGRLLPLPDLEEAFLNLYGNLLIPYVDFREAGFDGINDLIMPAEEPAERKEQKEAGEPSYVRYLLDTRKAEEVCRVCAGIENNERPGNGTYTDEDGTEYILRHSEQRIGGENGINTGLVGGRRWYRVSDDDPDMLLSFAIFGGWFGLHKFRQGEVSEGILYLMTCGCLGVLPATDILMMLAGNYSYHEVDYYDDEKGNLCRTKTKVYMKRPSKRLYCIIGIGLAFFMALIASKTLYHAVFNWALSMMAAKGTMLTKDEAGILYNRMAGITDNPVLNIFR